MNISDFYIATTLSVILGLIVEEYFGIISGGMIVPGILALHFYSWPSLLAIIVISIITYLLVEKVMSKYIILFGKRKFSAMILVALFLRIILDSVYPLLPFALVSIRGIGAITPALLANNYSKQGITYTLLSSFAVAIVIFFILNVYHMV